MQRVISEIRGADTEHEGVNRYSEDVCATARANVLEQRRQLKKPVESFLCLRLIAETRCIVPFILEGCSLSLYSFFYTYIFLFDRLFFRKLKDA